MFRSTAGKVIMSLLLPTNLPQSVPGWTAEVRAQRLRSDALHGIRLQMGLAPSYADEVRAALGVKPALKIAILTAAEATAYETEWRALAGRALQRNVFLEPAFALAAAQHLPEAGKPSFAVVFDGQDIVGPGCRIIGLLPFTTSTLDFGAPVIRGWKHPFATLGVPLLDATLAEMVLAALLEHMSARGFGAVVFSDIDAEGAFAATLRRVLEARGGVVAAVSLHARAILCTGTDAKSYFEQNWRPKKLKELQRLRRRLGGTGPLKFRRSTHVSDISGALERFMMLEASGWKGGSGTALVQEAGRATFARAMIRGLSLVDGACVAELWVGETLIASGITLGSGAAGVFWKIAYDERFARFSPGVLLTQDITREALDAASPAMIDSCAVADHPMIDRLWHERRQITEWVVPTGPSSRMMFRLAAMRERLNHRARSKLKALLSRLTR